MTIEETETTEEETETTETDETAQAAQKEIKTLRATLARERKAHKATRDELAPWKGLDHEEHQAKLDRLDALEAAGTGDKLDDDKVTKLVEAQVAAKLRPVERDRDRWKTKAEGLESENGEFRAKDLDAEIRGAMKKAAFDEAGEPLVSRSVLDSGDYYEHRNKFERLDSGEIVTKEGGQTPAEWVQDAIKARTHWQLGSQGGGARGKTGTGSVPVNIFDDDNWNPSAQAALITEKGEGHAKSLAKSVGATLALKPSEVKSAKAAGLPVYED